MADGAQKAIAKTSRRNVMPDSSGVDLNDLETWLPVYDFIDVERLGGLIEDEMAAFYERTPESLAVSKRAKKHLLNGVITQWHHNDWHLDHPLYVAHSKGNRVWDVDGNEYIDFNFGDTPDMFGHAPDGPVYRKSAAEMQRTGSNTMMTSEASIVAAELLQERFGQHMGLKYWSVAFSASIANQYAIKMARIITHKPKVLMFNFAYHGTVDETIKQMPEPGNYTLRCSMDVFPGQDLSATTTIVDFNDLEAVEAALATGEIAMVIAEPVFTNCGWWNPIEGFWDDVYALCRKYGAYLCFDETHTISVGHEGYAGKWKLKCDFWTCGKSISAGLPCAVYGFTEEVGEKFSHELHNCTGLAGAGTYGIGTLSTGNHLQMYALARSLENFFTKETYAKMIASMTRIVEATEQIFEDLDLPFRIDQMGNRAFIRSMPEVNSTKDSVMACGYGGYHEYLLFYGLNRGIMKMPYFPMFMTSPQTTDEDGDALVQNFREAFTNMLE